MGNWCFFTPINGRGPPCGHGHGTTIGFFGSIYIYIYIAYKIFPRLGFNGMSSFVVILRSFGTMKYKSKLVVFPTK